VQILSAMRRAVTGPVVADAVAEATGRSRRSDPVLPRTGGPAGNASLTAWTALVLLVGSVAELLTLFDVRGLISWHVAIGALLVPPALLKVASTGWRMARYYLGHGPYQEAGPPPLVLRVLGPLVVVSTLGLQLPALRVDWVTLHQAFFAVWVVATGLHLLGRIVPALRITVGPGGADHVPGAWSRRLLLASVVVSAAVLAVVLVQADGSWVQGHRLAIGAIAGW
jgi:hypothetical protein